MDGTTISQAVALPGFVERDQMGERVRYVKAIPLAFSPKAGLYAALLQTEVGEQLLIYVRLSKRKRREYSRLMRYVNPLSNPR